MGKSTKTMHNGIRKSRKPQDYQIDRVWRCTTRCASLKKDRSPRVWNEKGFKKMYLLVFLFYTFLFCAHLQHLSLCVACFGVYTQVYPPKCITAATPARVHSRARRRPSRKVHSTESARPRPCVDVCFVRVR